MLDSLVGPPRQPMLHFNSSRFDRQSGNVVLSADKSQKNGNGPVFIDVQVMRSLLTCTLCCSRGNAHARQSTVRDSLFSEEQQSGMRWNEPL